MSSSRNSADEPGSLEAIPLISSTSNTIEPNYVPLSETGSSSDNTPTNETGVCRICLETEILDNLDQPCACKGTLQVNQHDVIHYYAHLCNFFHLCVLSASVVESPPRMPSTLDK